MPSEDAGVKLRMTCLACPETYEGTVDGNPAYFRLRHSWWRFCIIEPGGNPVGPGATPDRKVLYYKDGMLDEDNVGIMENAQGFIMAMIREFRQAGEKKA